MGKYPPHVLQLGCRRQPRRPAAKHHISWTLTGRLKAPSAAFLHIATEYSAGGAGGCRTSGKTTRHFIQSVEVADPDFWIL
jgi:hypothetical protein